MYLEKIGTQIDAQRYLKRLGVDGGGIKILASKMHHHLFYIHDLHVGAANILKQDALSIGADLAVPKGTVTAQQSHVDAILIATHQQIAQLSRKELAQPFGLKALAKALTTHLKAHRPAETKVMGVLNANDDSFYAKSRYQDGAAIEAIITMMEDGADIIDIGAVSSRPGSLNVEAEQELARIKPIIDSLYEERLYDSVTFSVDSYAPSVIAYALEHGFKIVNDITGLVDDEICRLSAEYHATAVIMHMQGTPQTMQKAPSYEHLLSDITMFFEERMEKAERFGVGEVILDVGIGFGKTLQDNLSLIADLEHFLRLQRPLLIGASRKSMIDKIYSSAAEERLPGTLALHLKAVENGAAIIRTHDVKAHRQALAVHRAILEV